MVLRNVESHLEEGCVSEELCQSSLRIVCVCVWRSFSCRVFNGHADVVKMLLQNARTKLFLLLLQRFVRFYFRFFFLETFNGLSGFTFVSSFSSSPSTVCQVCTLVLQRAQLSLLLRVSRQGKHAYNVNFECLAS